MDYEIVSNCCKPSFNITRIYSMFIFRLEYKITVEDHTVLTEVSGYLNQPILFLFCFFVLINKKKRDFVVFIKNSNE